VSFLSGSESGFAMTPYGEFSARELTLMMRWLGIDAAEMLRIATSRNRKLLRNGKDFDSLAPGKLADLVAFDGNPLDDIAQLEERHRFVEIWMNGQAVTLPDFPVEIPRHPSESSQGYWHRAYTRASPKRRSFDEALGEKPAPQALA
jgi:hypothetical protein